MTKFLRNLAKAVGYLLGAMIIIELADRGLKAFIKAFDSYYQTVLKKKLADTNRMGETIITVLDKAKSNGAEKPPIL